MAWTDMGISPWPVMNMMGIWMFALASSAWKSSPLTPGNLTSSTRQLATSGSLLRNKSAAEPNVSTLRLTDRNRLLSASLSDSSSSTTNTIGASAVAGWRAERPITRFSPATFTRIIEPDNELRPRQSRSSGACLAAYEVHPLFTAALNQSIKASIVGLCSQSQNIVHLLIVTAYLCSHCKAPAVGLPPLQELGQTSVPWRSIMKALIAALALVTLIASPTFAQSYPGEQPEQTNVSPASPNFGDNGY